MKLREVSINSIYGIDGEREFNGNCQGIAHALTINLLGFDNEFVQKFAVEFCDSEEIDISLLGDNICIIKKDFNFHAYRQITDIGKLKLILSESIEALTKAFDYLSINYGNNLEPLNSEGFIESTQIEFIWSKGKKWNNRKKDYYSEIFYYFENGVLYLGARVVSYHDDKIVKEVVWESFPPHYMFISHLLGAVKWLNQNELNLQSKDKTITYSLGIA